MKACGVRLSAYLDGELSAAEMLQVAEHLRGCEACAAELAELQLVSLKLKSAPGGPAISPMTMHRLHLAVDRAAETARFRSLERVAGGLAALAACLAIVGGVLSWQSPRSGVEGPQAATLPADEDLALGKDTSSRDASVTALMVADMSGVQRGSQ